MENFRVEKSYRRGFIRRINHVRVGFDQIKVRNQNIQRSDSSEIFSFKSFFNYVRFQEIPFSRFLKRGRPLVILLCPRKYCAGVSEVSKGLIIFTCDTCNIPPEIQLFSYKNSKNSHSDSLSLAVQQFHWLRGLHSITSRIT